MQTPCTHGACPGVVPLSAMVSISEDLDLITKQGIKVSSSKKVLQRAGIRMVKLHARYVTDTGKSQVLANMLANATQHLLMDDLEPAQAFAHKSIQIQLFLWQEKLTETVKLWSAIEQVRDIRGLTLYLAKNIPCDCLKSRKEVAKKQEKMGFCVCCHKSFLFSSMKQCSECKVAAYCSATCQKENWKHHKERCAMLRESSEIALPRLASDWIPKKTKGKKGRKGKK